MTVYACPHPAHQQPCQLNLPDGDRITCTAGHTYVLDHLGSRAVLRDARTGSLYAATPYAIDLWEQEWDHLFGTARPTGRARPADAPEPGPGDLDGFTELDPGDFPDVLEEVDAEEPEEAGVHRFDPRRATPAGAPPTGPSQLGLDYAAIPIRAVGQDLRSPRFTPTERKILEEVNGMADLEEILFQTGLVEPEFVLAVDHLQKMRAIYLRHSPEELGLLDAI